MAGQQEGQGERKVGRNQVTMGLTAHDEAQHIADLQLINYGSSKGNLRSSRSLPK